MKRATAGALGAVLTIVGLILVVVSILSEPEERDDLVVSTSTVSDSDVERQSADEDAESAHAQARVRDLKRVRVTGDRVPPEEESSTRADETDANPDATEGPAQSGRQGHNPFGTRDPEMLREIAEQMRVGETVIAAAVRAEGLLSQTYSQRGGEAVRDEAKAALADLSGYGVEGFRGVLAMLRTGEVWRESAE